MCHAVVTRDPPNADRDNLTFFNFEENGLLCAIAEINKLLNNYGLILQKLLLPAFEMLIGPQNLQFNFLKNKSKQIQIQKN
jgi:hypothetical protein